MQSETQIKVTIQITRRKYF